MSHAKFRKENPVFGSQCHCGNEPASCLDCIDEFLFSKIIINITLSSNMIGLKEVYFVLTGFLSCNRTVR